MVAQKSPRKPEDYSEVLASMKPETNHLLSFIPHPVGLSYAEQEQHEQVLLFLRQHPVVNLPWIILVIVMIILPVLILPTFPPFALLPWNFKLVITLGWFLFVSGFAIERILVWLFNSFIITDERMIDIDFYSLIYKRVNYAQLDKIEDINTQIGGVLYSMLDVGTVFVQTAAEVPQFEISKVPHPSKVAKLLNELVKEEELEKYEGRVR
ncbi:MAG TPA: hypothetical protein VJ246_04085 [Patescibacteria group bacterium]|nr:hypothetical protein [Patescibacteria group bacterium]